MEGMVAARTTVASALVASGVRGRSADEVG